MGAAADIPQTDAEEHACRCCSADRTCSGIGTTATRSCERFVERAADNGMDVFRVFDALNDVRNLRTALAAVRHREARPRHDLLHHQPDAHDRALSWRWPSSLRTWARIRSASRTWPALLKPQAAYDLVKASRTLRRGHAGPRARARHHGRDAGLSMKAIEAGCDIVDTRSAALTSARATTRPRAWSRCSRAPASGPGWIWIGFCK